jgi:dihydrofolate reductase
MNNIRKHVVSTTLQSSSAWRNSNLIGDHVVEAIRQLKQQPGKNILTDGSSVLTKVLAEHDLVDEYALHVYPLVLGGGKRLFPPGKRLDLTLVERHPFRRASCTCATGVPHSDQAVSHRRQQVPSKDRSQTMLGCMARH